MNKQLTLEKFSSTNRSKTIGNSLYRISQDQQTKQWYIHETYNNGNTWAGNNAYYNDDLYIVINQFNNINYEKSIVSIKFDNL